VAALLAMAACSDGGGSAALSTLAEYAQGDWSCEITSADRELSGAALRFEATVEADSSTSGTFSFGSPLGMPDVYEGEWHLEGTSLEMDVAGLSRYAARGVELDTDRIEILEDAEGSEVERVSIDRHGDTVTFGWADPWSGADTTMDCTKA
jgi:hypothetical protein